MDISENNERTLLTVRQFSQKHPAFPEGGLRHKIFYADDKNGFARCIRRMGRKVLIDETAFFQWLDEQSGQAAS
ncbi:MAG: hypothetical protein ACLFP8_07230 [Alphaproteobacteria bacterium]